MTRCNLVAGAVATGAPLTDAERAHLDGCPDCAALVALPSRLASARATVEPGPGFAARMTAGAHRRLTIRRRRRVVLAIAATAAVALLAVLGTRALRPTPADQPLAPAIAPSLPVEQPARARDLLELTRFDRAMAPAALWRDIEAPLRAERALLNRHRRPSGETP